MKKAFLLPAFLFLMAAQAQAQEWTLERANLLLDTVQALFRQNPESPFPDPLAAQLDGAIKWAVPPASKDPLLAASLRYFRSCHRIVKANRVASEADLDTIKLLLKLRRDSASLDLLGSAYEMEHIIYTNFQFDFMRAKRAADTADIYFNLTECNNKFASTRIGAGMAFLSVKCGRCGEGEALVQRARRAYLALTDEQKAQDPTFEFYIPYISGNSQMCLGDSLRLAGEPEVANGAYRRGLSYYAQLDTTRSPSWVRGIFDFSAGRCHLYTQPTDPDSAVLHLTRAVAAFKENGMGDQAGLASVTLGWATVMTGPSRREAGLQLILDGLNALGYPVTTIYDQTLPEPERYKTLLVQALSVKAAALLYLYEAGGGTQRDLEQSLHDSEMAGDMLRSLQKDMDKNDQASFELAAGAFGQVFSLGAYAAAKLYQSTGQTDFLSRALTMADQGKNFTLWNYLRQSTLDPNIGIPNDTVAKVTLAQAQTLLDDSTALLEYVLMPGRKSLVIWVKRTESGVHFLEPFAQWKRQAEAYADALQNLSDRAPTANLNTFWKASAKLRPILLDSALLKKLRPSKHLSIVRDNVLWRVNFDLLALNPPGSTNYYRTLIEEHATSYPYSLNALRLPYKEVLRQEGDRGPGLEAFTANYGVRSGPCAPGGRPLQDLPDMCDTASQVVVAWGKGANLTPSATPEQFKANLREADIALIVLHGCIAPRQSPMEYKLVFSQQQSLTVEEIYKIGPVRARLVFMGACNTAWGRVLQGEGQANISRAFAFLGCPTLVSSVERVYDVDNAPIMKDFFEQFKKGHTAAYSLQQAKISALKKVGSPERWGSLLCLGNGMVHIPQGK